ncbi:hypothetical protein [Ruminococcus sp. FC2018]|uniref:hypothetical protein n=1 Tax=Ruminococcus sp. FC2018 TaxID=1410617 RepID=UPI000490560D|nr:hypothetical protein [Ruminococcus sp. FC2018]
MKNQYVGDIGDYGKYGLLRFLAGKGINIGVNWYLTKDDGSKDGKFKDYLSKDEFGCYDNELFKMLKTCKCVKDIERKQIIPNAVFFSDTLNTSSAEGRKERKAIRDEWHKKAMKKLCTDGADLIFADPDNGTLNPYTKPSIANGEKYTTLEELKAYYNEGKDVVYYCHRARRNDAKWAEKKKELEQVCQGVKIIVLTFHRGTQRSYIFGIHPERYKNYDKLINEFLKTDWGKTDIEPKKIPLFTKE